MPGDTPRPERPAKERGLGAGHGDDPTLAGYLSSLFFVVSVPALLVAAYGGHRAGLYGSEAIVPAFGGLLVASLAVAFGTMHYRTQ